MTFENNLGSIVNFTGAKIQQNMIFELSKY